MVKLEDPVAPFRGIVAKHRRAHAAGNAERLRLGGQAPTPRPSAGPVALLGASGWALNEERIEPTLAYAGALGGLLADLGYDVYAVSSLPQLDAPPALVGWVGGGETTTEREQLAAIDAPGLAVGPGLEDAVRWGSIHPDGQPTDIEFIRTALVEIRRLAAEDAARTGEAGAEPSTPSSTPRADTGSHETGRGGSASPRNPSSRTRSGTGWDRTNRRSSGS
jgi:hypothetical protein